MEILPGIYRVKISSPTVAYAHLNVYLIQGSDGFLMVDTGWNRPEALDSLEKQLGDIGLGFGDIEQIVITHAHPDHYGLAGMIKELSGAKLALHKEEIAVFGSKFVSMEQMWEDMALWMRKNGYPEDELLESQKATPWTKHYGVPGFPDILLNDGDIIPMESFELKVIWTPGHSPGHICLYDNQKKILLSGDHVLPTITPNVGRGPWTGDNPLGDYLTSLNNIKNLDVELILPAHEEPFTELQQRIYKLTCHHEQRKLAMLKVVNGGLKTGYEVASHVMWTANGQDTAFGELAAMDRRMALWETLSHLELLCVDGEVEKFSRDDTIYYRICKK